MERDEIGIVYNRSRVIEMPGQKRNELLTGTERERLINRRDMGDAKKRAANDSRAKKKLAAWADNLRDVELILENLPDEMSESAINEFAVYRLISVVEELLRVKEFRRICGDINDPASWQTAPGRPADELDIARSALLASVLGGVGQFLGADNPVVHAVALSKFYADPQLQKRLTDAEKKSVEKCVEATEKIYEVDLLGGSRGHNNIFCYNGYKHRGSVPVFSDTVF